MSWNRLLPAHATRLGEKLRRDGLAVSAVTVFYHTSEHDRGDPMRSVSTVVHMPEATNDSRHLIQAALRGVRGPGRSRGHRLGATARPGSSPLTSSRWTTLRARCSTHMTERSPVR